MLSENYHQTGNAVTIQSTNVYFHVFVSPQSLKKGI